MAQRKSQRSAASPAASAPTQEKLGVGALLHRDGVRAAAVGLWLLIVVSLIYGRGIHAPLIFDDANSVAHNPSVMRLWPLIGDDEEPGPLNPAIDLCTSGRPLVNLSLAINFHFSRFATTSYHVTNLVIHVVNALLLWAVVRRTLRLDFFADRFAAHAEQLALLVATIWAVHPLQTEAVEYITQRSELMMATGYLGALYASLRYWAAPSARSRLLWGTVAAAAMLWGAGCKEVIVSAPAMILLFERTFVAGSFWRALRNSWPLYLALLLGWVLLFVLNAGGPRSATAGFHVDLPVYTWWFLQCRALLMYLKLAIWPTPLVIHYEFIQPTTWAEAWPYVLSVAVLAVATVILVLRRTAAGFLLTWVVAILSPTLVVPIITEVAAERRMYLPLAALVALIVVGAYGLVLRWARGRRVSNSNTPRRALTIVGGACAIVTIACCVASARRVAVYNSPLAIWTDALAHQPDSSMIRLNLGITLTTLGRPQEAVPQLAEAVRMKPQDGGAHNNLGFALLLSGRPQEAIPHIEQAVSLSPDSAEALNNLGLAVAGVGRPQDAVGAFQKALELNPGYTDAMMNLGVVLDRCGRTDEAIVTLQRTIELDPGHLDAYASLAKVHLGRNQPAAAVAVVEQALVQARQQGRADKVGEYSSFLATQRGAGSTLPHGAANSPAP